jgi:hypothetical protein
VRAIAKLMPPRKVMLRDPAGAHQADAQGPVGEEGAGLMGLCKRLLMLDYR